jgi:hypothetical protein
MTVDKQCCSGNPHKTCSGPLIQAAAHKSAQPQLLLLSETQNVVVCVSFTKLELHFPEFTSGTISGWSWSKYFMQNLEVKVKLQPLLSLVKVEDSCKCAADSPDFSSFLSRSPSWVGVRLSLILHLP